MPYPQVIPTASEQQFIFNRLLSINNALFNYNLLTGISIPMPLEIGFEYLAIEQFQALSVQTLEGGTNTELQNGTDIAVTVGSGLEGGTNTELQTGTDTQVTVGNTTDVSSQTTTHGETVETTDADQTEYVGYDPTVALTSGDFNSPTIGLQAQPFPL